MREPDFKRQQFMGVYHHRLYFICILLFFISRYMRNTPMFDSFNDMIINDKFDGIKYQKGTIIFVVSFHAGRAEQQSRRCSIVINIVFISSSLFFIVLQIILLLSYDDAQFFLLSSFSYNTLSFLTFNLIHLTSPNSLFYFILPHLFFWYTFRTKYMSSFDDGHCYSYIGMTFHILFIFSRQE